MMPSYAPGRLRYKNTLAAKVIGRMLPEAMKVSRAKSEASGFTLIELLVVIAVVAVLAAIVIPIQSDRERPSKRIACMSNLRQVDLGFIMYASDHANSLPMQATTQAEGAVEPGTIGEVFPYVEKLRKYSDPTSFSKIWICPADSTRHAATNGETLSDLNISYFINTDTQITNRPAQTILAGDRNLTANGQPVKPGLFLVTTNQEMNWSHEFHVRGGNLAFADGHVEWCKTNGLNAVFANQPLAVNRLAVP